MKNITKLFFAAAFLTAGMAFAQSGVGVGTTTPDASAALDVNSTTKGFLMPRMTTVQRMAIATPANGLQVYDTDTKSFWYFDATVLPAPGAWIQATSATNGEWTYNGTDAIEATRALSNGNKVSISNKGNEYLNLGSYDWSTDINPPGLLPVWSSDPKFKFSNGRFRTSSVLALDYPNYTTTGQGWYLFDYTRNIVNESHVAAATGTQKRYFASTTDMGLKGVSSTVMDVQGNSYSTNIESTTSANITGTLAASRAFVNNYGSGTVNDAYASLSSVLNQGSGQITTLRGNNVQVTNSSTSTGNMTNLFGEGISITNTTASTVGATNARGLSVTYTHSGTGAIANQFGAYISNVVSGAASIPSNMRGNVVIATNSSTLAAVGSVNLTGETISTTNTGIAKFVGVRGADIVTSLTSTSGVPSGTLYGISNSLSMSSTSTDALPTMIGINTTVSNSSGATITDLAGGNFGVSHTSTTGTVTNMFGVKINNVKSGASVLGTNVGLYVGNVTGGTNNYSILTNTGRVKFGDDVENSNNLIFTGESNMGIKRSYVNATDQVLRIGINSPSLLGEGITSRPGGFLSFDTRVGASINPIEFRVKASGSSSETLNALSISENGNVVIGLNSVPVEKLEVNGAIKIGTTTTATPAAGTIRFNTTTSKFEGYDGTAWVAFH